MYKVLSAKAISLIGAVLGSILAAQNYSEPNTFGIKGVNNFYLNVVEDENVTLGIWQILPQEYLTNENFDYIGAMNNTKYSILIYLHGNGSDRTLGVDLYEILRKFFHIFAVDYRGKLLKLFLS